MLNKKDNSRQVMGKSKINWKVSCKWGIIFGIIGTLIIWLIFYINNNTNLVVCEFIEYIELIIFLPVLILLTIIFGPLGDRTPFLFHSPQGSYKIIAEIIIYIVAFITYFFIGVLVKIIYNKNKNKNKNKKNISLNKNKKGGE